MNINCSSARLSNSQFFNNVDYDHEEGYIHHSLINTDYPIVDSGCTVEWRDCGYDKDPQWTDVEKERAVFYRNIVSSTGASSTHSNKPKSKLKQLLSNKMVQLLLATLTLFGLVVRYG
jgi:hypothetical protein